MMMRMRKHLYWVREVSVPEVSKVSKVTEVTID
jgi:hypothetical protein